MVQSLPEYLPKKENSTESGKMGMQKQKEEDGFLALGAPTLAGKTGMMMM